jgi:hypothetical protein
MRNVTITTAENFQEAVCHCPRQYHTAIGYLSAWALGSTRYKNVTIHGDNEGNLHGIYRNEAGGIVYTLFGQFNDGEYSFHS